ncbi:hypothetical protein [Pseudarthrobacter sp. N5]|uniref:hypothetical protein n=1 Tax=Pseudarthrobacter sp. N5 TaxID=3418416 RepID=UPI003CEFDB8C
MGGLAVAAAVLVSDGQGDGLAGARVEAAVRSDGGRDSFVGGDDHGRVGQAGVDVEQRAHLFRQLPGMFLGTFGCGFHGVGGNAGHAF